MAQTTGFRLKAPDQFTILILIFTAALFTLRGFVESWPAARQAFPWIGSAVMDFVPAILLSLALARSIVFDRADGGHPRAYKAHPVPGWVAPVVAGGAGLAICVGAFSPPRSPTIANLDISTPALSTPQAAFELERPKSHHTTAQAEPSSGSTFANTSLQESSRAKSATRRAHLPTVAAEPQPRFAPPCCTAPVVEKANWMHQPSGDEIATAYPQTAARLGVRGQVQLKCTVTEAGSAQNCLVNAESPEGYGFAAAAVSLMAHARFHPETVDGAPRASSVTVPFAFSLPAPAEAPSTNAYRSSPICPRC